MHKHYKQRWIVASSGIQGAHFILFGTRQLELLGSSPVVNINSEMQVHLADESQIGRNACPGSHCMHYPSLLIILSILIIRIVMTVITLLLLLTLFISINWMENAGERPMLLDEG